MAENGWVAHLRGDGVVVDLGDRAFLRADAAGEVLALLVDLGASAEWIGPNLVRVDARQCILITYAAIRTIATRKNAYGCAQ